MANGIVKRILILPLLLVVLLGTWSAALDTPAASEVDAGMKRALASFALARALDAAISLAQGTEVSAGIGANVTISVGEVLDPVNDMVEAFSDLMLLASVAFGIQKVLLTIGQDMLIKGVLSGVLLLWGVLQLFGRRYRVLDVTLILVLMIRFAIPVVTLAADAIYQRFLLPEYTQSTDALQGSADMISQRSGEQRAPAQQLAAAGSAEQSQAAAPQPPAEPTQAPEDPEPGLWNSLVQTMREARDSTAGTVRDNLGGMTASLKKLDPRAYIDELKQQASAVTDHIIQLMVVFLLQTLLVPLFLLWAMYTALRGLLGSVLAPPRGD